MNKNSITQFLLDHAEAKTVSFHMPGHKGKRLFEKTEHEDFLDNIADMDITEIPGADNLFQTEGIIKETMARWSRLYESRRSYLLINGSSAGLIAAVLASTERGGHIIAARNSHKSIHNALVLGDVTPTYAYPEIVEGYGISGAITPEEIRRCIQEDPEASAVILPSPNYYGICSDIQAIADVCHEAGKILIVDQAHGAHLKFFGQIADKRSDLEDWFGFGEEEAEEADSEETEEINLGSLAAENQGADIIINSIHKTLASFTQTSVANVMSDRVDLQRFEDALGMIQSSSPSYILMASLDVAADIMEYHTDELMGDWKENIDDFYEAAAKVPGLHIMSHPMLDLTKINLDFSELGLNGQQLEALLVQLGIYPELVTGNIVMCMTGIGNVRTDYTKLLEMLYAISQSLRAGAEAGETAEVDEKAEGVSDQTDLPQPAIESASPADQSQAQPWSFIRLESKPIPTAREELQLDDAAGRVCARAITPYPPGIPIACPGEVLTEEILTYVKELRAAGQNVMGISEEGTISVGK